MYVEGAAINNGDGGGKGWQPEFFLPLWEAALITPIRASIF